MTDTSVGLVPESTGPKARVIRTTVGSVDVDTQVVKSIGIIASDGNLLDVDSLAQTLAYNADGTLNYVQVVNGALTYRQTLTYSSGNVSAVSAWVLQ